METGVLVHVRGALYQFTTQLWIQTINFAIQPTTSWGMIILLYAANLKRTEKFQSMSALRGLRERERGDEINVITMF